MCSSLAPARLRSGLELRAAATNSYRSSSRAAMRCTAPINAPGPPPTMPRRKRCEGFRFGDAMGISRFLSIGEAKHPSVCLSVCSGFGEIVEGAFGRLDNMARNERSALLRALVAALDATLPFENGPSVEVVLSEL